MSTLIRPALALVALVVSTAVFAASPKRSTLEPLLAVPDAVVLQEDFAQSKPLAKRMFTARQGTRWSIGDGVLRGIPSSAEFRAKKKDHFGYEPRLSIPACPQEYIIAFDVRFLGGKPTAIVPFVEFGHHVARIAWPNGGGAKLIVDHETVQVGAAPDFKIKPGKWYRALAELKGGEFVIQFADGPTLHARHASLTGKNDGFGVAGNKEGTVELDNITVWSVKAEPQPTWPQSRAALPTFEPTIIKKAPARKK